ncbi:MAG: hypothetical protein U9P90_04440 [Patescibacteria group bacterium]|nr:hypothetical protein [Patescibacteria group bacterium]
MNFYSFGSGENEFVVKDMYPELSHPNAIEFFFFICLHEHGFWLGGNWGYLTPLFGIIKGKKCKGSELLWKSCKHVLDNDPEIFSP